MTKKGDKSNLLIGSVKESSEVKPHTFILQLLKAFQIYFIFMFCTWMGWGRVHICAPLCGARVMVHV